MLNLSGIFTKQQLVRRLLIPADRLLAGRYSGQTGILMYHRVTPVDSGSPAPTFNVTPARFRGQLEGLLKLGFFPCTLQQVLQNHREGHAVPARAFVITFDDGYECVYRHAWPVLKDLGIPATVFLATKYISSGHPFPFDDWPAAGSARVSRESWCPLTVEQCREMAEGGLIELGVHTHTHLDFRNRPADFREDLAVCVHFMRENFAVDRPSFAFPFGHASPELAREASDAELACALTIEDELVNPGSSPYNWGRFGVTQADTAHTLSTCLDGWYSFTRKQWRTLRAACFGGTVQPGA